MEIEDSFYNLTPKIGSSDFPVWSPCKSFALSLSKYFFYKFRLIINLYWYYDYFSKLFGILSIISFLSGTLPIPPSFSTTSIAFKYSFEGFNNNSVLLTPLFN